MPCFTANYGDPNKRVDVVCLCSIDGEVSITIRDQGQGFNSSSRSDPTAPENQMSAQGRGIYLMRASMDEIHFDEGFVVCLWAKSPTPVPPRTKVPKSGEIANETEFCSFVGAPGRFFLNEHQCAASNEQL